MANVASTFPFDFFGRRVDKHLGSFASRVEETLGKAIACLAAYLNDDVVPAVRSYASRALRIAAQQLGRLAEHLERNPGMHAQASVTADDRHRWGRQA